MKHKMFLFALLMVAIFGSERAMAESDTLWTKYIGSTVQTVKFSPDGRYVYAAVLNYGILKLDANNGEIIKEFDNFKYENEVHYNALDVSSDGKWVVGGEYFAIYILNSETGEVVKTLKTDLNENQNIKFNDVKITKDNKYVIANMRYSNGEITHATYIWNIENNKIVHKFYTNYGIRLALSPNNDKFVVAQYQEEGGEVSIINLIEIGTWKELGVLEGHQNRIEDLSFSPDGSLLASRDFDTYLVKIWDIQKQELGISFKPNGTYTGSVSLIENNKLISSSGNLEDLRLRTTNLTTKLEINNILNRAGDFEVLNNLIIAANQKSIILLKADKLLTISLIFNTEKLFPNPANQIITVPKNYFNDNFISLNVIDLNGKEWFKMQNKDLLNNNQDFAIDINNYPKGSYIVQFFYTTNIQTLKFIKE